MKSESPNITFVVTVNGGPVWVVDLINLAYQNYRLHFDSTCRQWGISEQIKSLSAVYAILKKGTRGEFIHKIDTPAGPQTFMITPTIHFKTDKPNDTAGPQPAV